LIFQFALEETFAFAHDCKSGGKFFLEEDFKNSSKEERPAEWLDAIKKANRDNWSNVLTLAGLGLTEVKDTYVGDTAVRGVSGGQRRRVTVGELLTYRASVLCGDEISTGLDAASTYDMVQVLLYFGKFSKLTRIISLLQPSPETVSLFDEVIVLAKGQIIYAGPVDAVEDYFAEIGFGCPAYMDCADFLQMVSTEEGSRLYDPLLSTRVGESSKQNPTAAAPTITELAKIFRRSQLGLLIQKRLDAPHEYIWTKKDSVTKHALSKVSNISKARHVKRKYANSFFLSTWLILKRFLRLWVRDRRVIIAGFAKNVLMGVSVGGVYFNTLDPVSIQGALFQAGLFIMLGTCVFKSSEFILHGSTPP